MKLFRVLVPVFLAVVGVGAKHVRRAQMTPLARSTLALVLLWYAEPTRRHEPIFLRKARNTLLVNLASWSITSTSGRLAPEPRGAEAHVANDRRSS